MELGGRKQLSRGETEMLVQPFELALIRNAYHRNALAQRSDRKMHASADEAIKFTGNAF
ncbi:hypothetical protein D3C78_1780900 [compost metagenome]